jgi:hypothetical protein
MLRLLESKKHQLLLLAITQKKNLLTGASTTQTHF